MKTSALHSKYCKIFSTCKKRAKISLIGIDVENAKSFVEHSQLIQKLEEENEKLCTCEAATESLPQLILQGYIIAYKFRNGQEDNLTWIDWFSIFTSATFLLRQLSARVRNFIDGDSIHMNLVVIVRMLVVLLSAMPRLALLTFYITIGCMWQIHVWTLVFVHLLFTVVHRRYPLISRKELKGIQRSDGTRQRKSERILSFSMVFYYLTAISVFSSLAFVSYEVMKLDEHTKLQQRIVLYSILNLVESVLVFTGWFISGLIMHRSSHDISHSLSCCFYLLVAAPFLEFWIYRKLRLIGASEKEKCDRRKCKD